MTCCHDQERENRGEPAAQAKDVPKLALNVLGLRRGLNVGPASFRAGCLLQQPAGGEEADADAR